MVLGAGLAAAGWLAWRAGGLDTLAWLVLATAVAVAVASLAYCRALWRRCRRQQPPLTVLCAHCRQHCTGTVDVCTGTVGSTVDCTVDRLPPPTAPALSDSAAARLELHWRGSRR